MGPPAAEGHPMTTQNLFAHSNGKVA